MSATRDESRLVVVTAVGAETRAVLAALTRPKRIALAGLRAWDAQAGTRAVTLVQAGIGPMRARAALQAVHLPHGLIVSVGFAGALVAEASPGDIVLPDTILWEDDTGTHRYTVPARTWQTARAPLIEDLPLGRLQGALLSSPIVLASPEAKRSAARRCGAVAVEMEAAALVAVARDRGIALVVLRAILDTVDVSLEQLPPDLDSSWLARARLVGRPGAWPGVLALTRQIPHVARALTQASAAVLSAL